MLWADWTTEAPIGTIQKHSVSISLRRLRLSGNTKDIPFFAPRIVSSFISGYYNFIEKARPRMPTYPFGRLNGSLYLALFPLILLIENSVMWLSGWWHHLCKDKGLNNDVYELWRQIMCSHYHIATLIHRTLDRWSYAPEDPVLGRILNLYKTKCAGCPGAGHLWQPDEGREKKQVSTTVYRFFLLLLPGHVFMDITDTGDVVWTLRTGDISLCMRPRRRLVHHGGTNNLWYENVPTVQNTAGAKNNTFHMLALAKYSV